MPSYRTGLVLLPSFLPLLAVWPSSLFGSVSSFLVPTPIML